MKALHAHTARTLVRLGVGLIALGCLSVGHAQTYQVGQYLGNFNDAGRFAYGTMGTAAQHANSGPSGAGWTTLPAQNSVRLAGTATATIGGRTVPLTLVSRVPIPAIANAARVFGLANPATAAVTLLGFAAMQGWLTPAGLEWNTDPATQLSHPFRAQGEPDPQYICDFPAGTYAGLSQYVRDGAGPGPGDTSYSSHQYFRMPSPTTCEVGRVVTWSGNGIPVYQSYATAPVKAQPGPMPTVPVTWDEGVSKLSNIGDHAKLQGVDWKGITEQLLQRGASIPAAEIKDQTVTGPASQTGTTTTTTNSTTGNTTNTTTNHNYTYNTNNVTHNTTTTTTITNNAGDVISNETTTTNNTPPTERPDQPDPCEKNPDRIGCQRLDTPTGEIPRAERTISYAPMDLGLGNGQCPSPVGVTTMLGQHTLAFDPACSFLTTWIRPVVIAFALLAAFFIVAPGRSN